ncbi:protein of unknown function (plasmid) [Paraburkholderia kururiensis]
MPGGRMRSAAAGEHRTGEDTAKRTLGRARRRATVAKRDGELRGLATGVSAREGKNAARRAPFMRPQAASLQGVRMSRRDPPLRGGFS